MKRPKSKVKILVTQKRKGGEWWFSVVSNGRIICHSEQYTRKAGAMNAVRLLTEELANAEVLINGVPRETIPIVNDTKADIAANQTRKLFPDRVEG